MAVAPVSKMTTLPFFAKKTGQSTFKEAVKECSTDFLSDGVSSEVMGEKDERGRGGGAEGGAGASFPCLIGQLGRR